MGDKRVWYGLDSGNEGDWNVNANWLDEEGVAADTPDNGDDVFFTSGSQDVIDVSGSLDQSGVALDSFTVGPKYTGTIGPLVDSVETPLKLGSITGEFRYGQKNGVAYIDGDSASTFADVIIETTDTVNPAIKFTNITITDLTMTGGKGTVYIDSTAEITGDIKMIGCRSATLELEAGSTVDADLTISDGRLLTYVDLTTITMFGGLVGYADAGAGTLTTLTMYDGTCKFKPTSDTTLINLIMYGGFFDARGATASDVTITNTTIYDSAIIDERNGLRNIDWENSIDAVGGIIQWNPDRIIDIS